MRQNNVEIILRPLKQSDAESLAKHANDRSVSRFTTVPYPYTVEMAKKFIRKTSRNLRSGKAMEYGIELEGKIIGMCSIDKIDGRKGELGYWLGKKFRKKGIMSKAVKIILNEAFARRGLKKVYAHVISANIPSSKLLRKIGFKKEGVLRKHEFRNGRYWDVEVYGLLSEEWRQLKHSR